MRDTHFLLFLALSGLAFSPAAFSAEPLNSSEQRLVGIWEEDGFSAGVFQYYPDHTEKVYLTKEEGAQLKMHWIEATWTLSPKSVLTVNLSANGKSDVMKSKLVFKNNNEIWVTVKGHTTKMHRLSGELPTKYRW